MQQPFVPGVAVEPTSRVEITLSAKNLANKDYFSKSDPFIVTYESEPGVFNWRECHRTEVIRDNLNPQFVRKLVMNYRFEAQQKLRFENSLNSSLKNPKILPPIAGLPTEKRSAEMALLSQEVLAEIPAQFLGYMESQGIRPNPPKTGILNIPQDPEVLVGDFEQ
ncbi:unnamed protein product [Notodromas monacha]|uniref:C2 domain-containing protein n=1 Tax=Notodromas monacha TaxID=399045 RepID=A0A7R9C060_9CRUS|nr:unnamed protein product [Notodromas monacha]CAG0924876.1 unnamed protein product [Notodromas monacha]